MKSFTSGTGRAGMLHDGAAMSWTSGARAARPVGSDPIPGARVTAARAGVFTAASTGLAVTGHHLASGHPVPWRAVLLAAGVLFALVVPVARSLRSLPGVVAATGAAQAGLHLWLARAGAHPAAGGHAMDDHGHPHGAHETWHAGHHGASMTAAHVAAALLVAWLMQRADAACRAVAQRLGHALAGFFVRPAPAGLFLAVPRVLRPVGARGQSPPRNVVVLAHAVVRRGPPSAKPALAV